MLQGAVVVSASGDSGEVLFAQDGVGVSALRLSYIEQTPFPSAQIERERAQVDGWERAQFRA